MSGSPTHSFDAFLSYSTRGDYRISRRVEAFIERFHTVIARSGVDLPALRVCRDGSDFRQVLSGTNGPDDAIWQRIQTSLATSKRVIVLCSPESAASLWVDREVRWALANKEPGSVLLVVTAGADPATDPEGVIPPAAIEAGLHRGQLWYDLRQWRGNKNERVRDAEDELVRLALDLLDHPLDAQPDIATIWQREDLKRRRRTLHLATTALGIVTLALGAAAWQFDRASTRAAESRASSLVRIASALRDESPLIAALLFAEVDVSSAPNDALDVGYTLLEQEFPLASLRGHRHMIVAGTLADDQMVRTIDQSGHMRTAAADGYGPARNAVIAERGKIQDAFVHEDRQTAVLAFRDGDIVLWRNDGSSTTCRAPGFKPKKLTPSKNSRQVLVIGFNRRSLVCDFERSEPDRAKPVITDTDLVSAWIDDSQRDTWLAMTHNGVALSIDEQTAEARHFTSMPPPIKLTASGYVDWVTPGSGGAIAIKAGEALFVGRSEDNSVRMQVMPLVTGVGVASFAPDGERLAIATNDGNVSLFSTKGWRFLSTLAHPRPAGPNMSTADGVRPLQITALAWSPDGTTLATLQAGVGLRLWREDDEKTWRARTLRGHDGALSVRWSPDSSRVATLGDDGEVHVWAAQKELANPFRTQIEGNTYSGAVSAETGTVLIGGGSGRVWIFDKGRMEKTPQALEATPPCPGAEGSQSVELLALEAREGGFWSARSDGALSLWRPATGNSYTMEAHHCTRGKLFAYSSHLGGMVFMGPDRSLTFADAKGARLIEKAPPTQDISRLKLSPDGRWAVGGTEEGALLRWDLSSRPAQLRTWRPHKGKAMCIDVNNAGEVLSTSMDGTAVFSRLGADSVNTAAWEGDGPGDEKWMESCALGKGRAVVSSSTGHAWVIDPTKPGVKSELRHRIDAAHVGSINSIALAAPDLAITGGLMDGRARIWNTRTLRLLAQLPINSKSAVTALLIKPDGNGAYILAESGELRLLPVSIQGVQRAIRDRTSAELSPPERGELLGDEAEEAYARYAEREAAHVRQAQPREWRFEIPF